MDRDPAPNGVTSAPPERSSKRDPVKAGWVERVRQRMPFGKPAPRVPHRLRTLMRVFAGFSMVDGKILEGEIDSTLAFLRNDYPSEIHGELRDIYEEALRQPQDINAMAGELADEMTGEEKILLGVQLFVLLSRAESRHEHLVAFYFFMNSLGVASEAIDLVYQLDEDTELPPESERESSDEELDRPLESLRIGPDEGEDDLLFENLPRKSGLAAFRYKDLVLLKNLGRTPLIVRGHRVGPEEFCRLYRGQRLVLGDVVLGYEDLVYYFNAKKDLAAAKLYLSFAEDGTTLIERSPSRTSELQIEFGLVPEVKALRPCKATIAGKRISAGHLRKVGLGDVLEPPDSAPVTFASLARRARDLGSQFELKRSRSTYEVSNNPDLLSPGDILLASGLEGEMHLRIHCNYARQTGELEVVRTPTPIQLGSQVVKGRTPLKDGDTITLAEGRFLHCDFSERIVEEQRTVVRQIEVEELRHAFDPRETALDGVSFSASRGEMICVMGPSGCGKSTLLRVLAGQQRPQQGKVLLDDHDLYGNVERLRPLIAFMPQEDAIDPLLTVGENLASAAAIRSPHLPSAEREKRIQARAVELGLAERLDRVPGNSQSRVLSGGERKRLNLGLDMTGIADIYLLDEPTSGLSSKDSEHVLEIIHALAHNKIVLVSIHQPSARLFQLFDKALLLDRGGVPVFFGTPDGMLNYFTEIREEFEPQAKGQPVREDMQRPEQIFDLLETPLRDPGGEVIHDENDRGHLTVARRFGPDFWGERFQAHTLRRRIDRAIPDQAEVSLTDPDAELIAPRRRSVRHWLTLFITLVKRTFRARLRSRGNLATTLFAAPALALFVGTLLRYSEDDTYTFAAAYHIPTYLFISLVVAMLLGLTNSADEIIRDRPLLSRERNHRLPVGAYVLSKLVVLGFFAVVQMAIYLLIANTILEFRSNFGHHLLWMVLTALAGVSAGLLISSFVRDAKTALNLIPVVLIPNMVLGGALIKYEEMNKNLDLVYSLRRWLAPQEGETDPTPPNRLEVPLSGEFMPLRWSYEAIVIAQTQRNPKTRTQHEVQKRLDRITAIRDRELTEAEDEELFVLKEAKAKVSAMYAEDDKAIATKLERFQNELRDGSFDPSLPEWNLFGQDLVEAGDIYVNRKLDLLVEKAEVERNGRRNPNVFFGTRKRYTPLPPEPEPGEERAEPGSISTILLNLGMMIGFITVPVLLLVLLVRRQLTRV